MEKEAVFLQGLFLPPSPFLGVLFHVSFFASFHFFLACMVPAFTPSLIEHKIKAVSCQRGSQNGSLLIPRLPSSSTLDCFVTLIYYFFLE